MATNCTHLDQIHDVEPSAQGCEEMQKLLSELHRFAEVTQLMSERFA